jgi:hypothetical protein
MIDQDRLGTNARKYGLNLKTTRFAQMHAVRAEGVGLIRRSRLLDPAVIGPIPEALLALEQPPWLCSEGNGWPVLCETMPVVMVEKLEQMLWAGAALLVLGPAYWWTEQQNARQQQRSTAERRRHAAAAAAATGGRAGSSGQKAAAAATKQD